MNNCSYLVMQLYPTDLNNIIRTQSLTEDHIILLVYQLLRGLKVTTATILLSPLGEACSPAVEEHSNAVFSFICFGCWKLLYSETPLRSNFSFRISKKKHCSSLLLKINRAILGIRVYSILFFPKSGIFQRFLLYCTFVFEVWKLYTVKTILSVFQTVEATTT